MKPVCVDLFTGLHGFGEGFLAEGYEVIGFDIADMCKLLDHERKAGIQLILQDVLTIHGEQFKPLGDRLRCIVASPPCTEYSYMAMPWTRAKQIRAGLLGNPAAFPAGYKGSRTIEELNALFNACFRIQREASEALGRHIPMVVENVKGAQPWVGPAKANFGSFFLWGDVGRIGNRVVVLHGQFIRDTGLRPRSRRMKFNPDGTAHPVGSWFKVANSKNRGSKGSGQDWSLFAKTGEVSPHWRMEVTKTVDHQNIRDGHSHTRHLTNQAEHTEGVKFSQTGAAWFDGKPRDKMLGEKGPAVHSSKSNARKAASAQIARIPFTLARHIARNFLPQEVLALA